MIISSKKKMMITYALFIIVCICLFFMFGLDARYANNPQTPNAAVGRIIEHSVRYHVYLTAGEYAPYVWLTRILIGSGVLIVILHATDFLWNKIQKFLHSLDRR